MTRVLVARLSALGDVACTLPVAAALKRGIPDAHVSWAVDPRFAGLVRLCTAVDEVIEVKPSVTRWPRFSDNYDIALDAQGLLKSALCAHRSGAKMRLGYHWRREGAWLFSSAVTPDPTSVHVVDQYLDVARAAGGEASTVDFALSPPSGVDFGLTGSYAVINAGAGWVTKRWTPEGYGQLIRFLADRGIRSVLIGGKAPADRDAADAVLALADPQPVDLLGKTSISELVALLAGARLHVGGDTGSTHIAAALGTPVVGLYALTRIERSGPYGQLSHALRNPQGMNRIAPADVLQMAEKVLAESQSRR